MPKGKIEGIKGNKRVRLTVTRKFKIGGRKSVRSAPMMSNDELRSVFANSSRAKDKQTARAELERRGAALIIEEPA